jgi:hypothetical protein
MNSDIKVRWIAALRSGKYKQAFGTLHKFDEDRPEDEGFCCLGVLCEIAVQDGVVKPYRGRDSDKFMGYVPSDFDEDHGFADYDLLPSDVKDWADISSSDGGYGHQEDDEHRDSLTKRNDEDRLSFLEIADIIEKNF